MKKVLAIVLALVMTLALFAACSNKNVDTDTTVADADTTTDAGAEVVAYTGSLMNEGKLTVGCEAGYPPFEDIKEDGSYAGYDIDIITVVATRLGLEAEIINTAWDGIFTGIDTNYDVVCSAVTITAERQESMLFTTPYINNYQAVVVPTGSELEINSFEDLDGLTIAVQKETTSDILMSDYKSTDTIDVEIVQNEKVTTCFTQLTQGEIDAVVVDSTVADGYIASDAEHYTIAYLDKSEPEQFGIAMGLGNTELQEAINAVLADMEADGTIQEIYDFWFGTVAEE